MKKTTTKKQNIDHRNNNYKVLLILGNFWLIYLVQKCKNFTKLLGNQIKIST